MHCLVFGYSTAELFPADLFWGENVLGQKCPSARNTGWNEFGITWFRLSIPPIAFGLDLTVFVLGFWQFKLDGFSVLNYVNTRSFQVSSGTGTSYIYAPSAVYNAMVNAANGRYNSKFGVYTVPCNSVKSLPDWVFTIGGKKYNVPATEYVVDVSYYIEYCNRNTNKMRSV